MEVPRFGLVLFLLTAGAFQKDQLTYSTQYQSCFVLIFDVHLVPHLGYTLLVAFNRFCWCPSFCLGEVLRSKTYAAVRLQMFTYSDRYSVEKLSTSHGQCYGGAGVALGRNI